MPTRAPSGSRYAVHARALLHDELLDAAREEMRERRWADIAMADISRAAGVSRGTLYNQFGSREQFARALVMRETGRLLDTVERTVRANRRSPLAAVQATFTVFLTAASENRMFARVLRGEAGELLALLPTHGEPLLQCAARRLRSVIIDAWPLVRPADAELLSEALVRLAFSYAAMPTKPVGRTATSVAALLGPYVEQVLSGPAPRARQGRRAEGR